MPLHHSYFGNLQGLGASESYLELMMNMDFGYMGAPFVSGQVNMTGGDSVFPAMGYGYLGAPFIVWTNIT